MKIIRKIIITILGLCIILVSCFRAIGCKSFKIESGSMEPEISINDIVWVHRTDFATLKTDDVITYISEDNTPITHRIISINSDDNTVITKGDSNEYSDIMPVAAENIIGKVIFKIPKLGVIYFFNNRGR